MSRRPRVQLSDITNRRAIPGNANLQIGPSQNLLVSTAPAPASPSAPSRVTGGNPPGANQFSQIPNKCWIFVTISVNSIDNIML